MQYGFIIFSGVPCVDKEVLQAASVFGFTRETNFGAFFNVRSEPNASDLAYTSLHLDPHTDNPYRSPVPGVQLLHCLANETSGGLSTLVDGIAVGEALRARDPEAFQVLSTTPVRFRYRDSATELVASAPPIELDVSGKVKTIHFSPRLDFVPLLPPPRLTAYYRARRLFDHMLRSTEFEIRFLLASGDLVMFDNCRLLHGRTSFDPAAGPPAPAGLLHRHRWTAQPVPGSAPPPAEEGIHMTALVSFTRMEDGTKEDYELLDRSEQEYARQSSLQFAGGAAKARPLARGLSGQPSGALTASGEPRAARRRG